MRYILCLPLRHVRLGMATGQLAVTGGICLGCGTTSHFNTVSPVKIFKVLQEREKLLRQGG